VQALTQFFIRHNKHTLWQSTKFYKKEIFLRFFIFSLDRCAMGGGYFTLSFLLRKYFLEELLNAEKCRKAWPSPDSAGLKLSDIDCTLIKNKLKTHLAMRR
jgi:hypothetical protein